MQMKELIESCFHFENRIQQVNDQSKNLNIASIPADHPLLVAVVEDWKRVFVSLEFQHNALSIFH